jgi:outer membrane protein OmpA-like peptidoglycan-associated protein
MRTSSTASTGHGTRRRSRERAGAVAVTGLLFLGAWGAMMAVAQSPPVPSGPAAPPGAPATTLPGPKPLSASEAPRYMRLLARELRAATGGTPVEVSTASRDLLRLRIAAADLFDLDAAQLRAEGPVRLDPLVAALSKSDRTELVVVGHTDTLGTREYNAAWSLRRATAVADYLQAKGIAASRITVRGAGELELREKKDDTPEARARNRRIEIEVRPSRPSRRAAS